MARITKKTNVNVSLSEAQEAAHSYAQHSNRKDKLTAEMNQKIATIREKYEPDITQIDGEMEEYSEVLQVYALEQRKNWDGKSIELANCIIGFRTNPPSVTKKKGLTWEGVVGLLKASKVLKTFVKVKEDVDKSAILKVQADQKIMKALSLVGVTVEQEEQFYVDTKKEKAA
jgi:phage host-nuclease inhibitor protein Gam